MWLLYSADSKTNGANKAIGKLAVRKLASVEWARRKGSQAISVGPQHTPPNCRRRHLGRVCCRRLGATGATRLCVVGCLRCISAVTPVFLGRDGSHRVVGPHEFAVTVTVTVTLRLRASCLELRQRSWMMFFVLWR
jgi:hypothetical protein